MLVLQQHLVTDLFCFIRHMRPCCLSAMVCWMHCDAFRFLHIPISHHTDHPAAPAVTCQLPASERRAASTFAPATWSSGTASCASARRRRALDDDYLLDKVSTLIIGLNWSGPSCIHGHCSSHAVMLVPP